MNIPQSIINTGTQPHWCGEVNGEEVQIYFDGEMSYLTSSNVYAVFSDLGFHGWMDEGYDNYQLLWLVTGIAIPYEQAIKEYKQNFEFSN